MDELLAQYERELVTLRQLCREYSERYPKIASKLQMGGETCDDPHVERLIQSVALLCARVSKRLDDSYPQFTEALLNLLFPHFLRPFPSCAIVQFASSLGQEATADVKKIERGFPQAINAVFPQTQVQTCIVHLIRNSLDFVGWKDRKLVAAELKTVYRPTTEAEAAAALAAFAAGPWGLKYRPIADMWRRQWQEVVPFFAYPLEVRRIVYTTNAIESLNMQVRKVIKNRSHFPNDDAATKLIWLALRNIAKNWKMPPITWRAAKTQFAILFAERFTAHL